ncbi:hypothetical protein [Neobacillus massiliamazoniensis]|uniref:Uncharacterized protein n=1 Tax=Neobacillus massiliamazoniensis TaxID=1499688 RepID=A0A0U1NQJ6_9BACI|nr:hypothetical protein [Neobacillus massiliamazoniensis]CRK80321.1 hypothetical protein BN000_00202 [Neobacillus massiliamazoniensis]
MRNTKEIRFKDRILNQQYKYEKLRKHAYKELKVLEEHFSKRQVDKGKIYSDILIHLQAYQKEISYNGLRGVTLGILTTILVYIFNTGVIAQLLKIKISMNHWVAEAIGLIFGTIILGLYFLCMYFLGAGHFFIEDIKRRKQIYVNEYLIKIVEEKIEAIKNNMK